MTAPDRGARRLAADRSGAVMVMGVFMAALMVGFIYYVKGVGEAIVFRERMQDAADSAAFASATVHARGMNLIALINISMASVLAVVTATRLIQSWAIVAIFLSALQAPGDVEPLKDVRAKATDHYTTIVRPLFGILRAANTTANAAATAIPLAAEAQAIDTASSAFRPPVETAFAFPSFRRLPVESSSIGELIGRAGPPAVPLAIIPFRPFGVAMDFLDSRGTGELTNDAINEARAIMSAIESPSALEGMVPQNLAASAVLGGDRLQLSVVVGGNFDFALSERGVEVASWGQTEANEEEMRALGTLSRVSLAQGEYFYAGPGGRDEWLWNQQWRARLRRVRLAAPTGYPCVNPSISCDALDEMFRRGLHDSVVH